MNEAPAAQRTGASRLAGAVLIGLFVTQTFVLLWFVNTYLNTARELSDTLDEFLDAQIDAGKDDPTLTPDDPLLRDRRVLLFHDVNSRTAKDVSARLLYLNSIDDKAPINLYISTQGGWSDNAFTIIDTMRAIAAPVNTWAVGGCYSAGALILAAATGRRYATENSILMIHTNLEESSDEDAFPRLARERYERVYRERTKLPTEWYPMTDDQRHYLTPEQALEFHLVDEVVPVWERSGEKK